MHYFWRASGLLKPWYLLIICLIFAGLSVYGLRRNYATMVSLREDLFAADEAGKSADELEVKLVALRDHVTQHMNTHLRTSNLAIKEPPIQLSGLYNRAYAAEKERVSQVNAALYTTAQAECEKLFPIGLSGSGRIPCIEQYVNERGEKQRDIPREVYMFDFITPRWSPDLAGWSLVLATVFGSLAALKLAADVAVRNYLKHRQ